jgi:hypothetical protein
MGYAADVKTFQELRFIALANDELARAATDINY